MKFDKPVMITGTKVLNSDTFVLGVIDPDTDDGFYVVGVSKRAAQVAEAFKGIDLLMPGTEYNYLVAKIPTEMWDGEDSFVDYFIEMGAAALIGTEDKYLVTNIKARRQFVYACYNYWLYCVRQYGKYDAKTVDAYNAKKFLNDFKNAIMIFELYEDNKKDLFRLIDFMWRNVINRK